MDVTIWGALLAGVLSFISPCILPMVPPYLCFLAGVTLDEFTGESVEAERRVRVRARVVLASAFFVLGFSTIFVMLGVAASAFGQQLRRLQAWTIDLFGLDLNVVQVVIGLFIIVMGLHFLGAFRISLFNREARVQVQRRPAGPFSAYLFGMAFAFGWTPCIGPVLSTIMAVAGTRDTVGQGAFLLAVYSAGMGIPFLAAAFFAGPFMRLMRRFRRHMGSVERAMGALLVLTGVLFLTGQMTVLSQWLLRAFPGLVNLT